MAIVDILHGSSASDTITTESHMYNGGATKFNHGMPPFSEVDGET